MHDDLCEQTITRFVATFGKRPAVVACAPGRVNLIGEHTDYQDGLVFPVALDRKTVVALTLTGNGQYRIVSGDWKAEVCWSELPCDPPAIPEWHAYILGTINLFVEVSNAKRLTGNPLKLNGFDVLCLTTVPIGGGLSSSAALEVATATAMEAAIGVTLDPLVKAREICQQAEHRWAKVPCGLMDQAISVMAVSDHAMLFDCKTQIGSHLPFPSDIFIIVINSGLSHTLASGEYTQRRASCERSVQVLQELHPQVHSLRDVSPEMLQASINSFSDPVDFKRATHVVHENRRVLAFAEALKRKDLDAIRQIMSEGHQSLHVNYSVTIPETDAIVEIAQRTDGVFGARMTGGGFGGCVCVLAQSTKAEAAMKSILEKYLLVFNDLQAKSNSDDHVVRHAPSAFIARASRGAVVFCSIFDTIERDAQIFSVP